MHIGGHDWSSPAPTANPKTAPEKCQQLPALPGALLSLGLRLNADNPLPTAEERVERRSLQPRVLERCLQSYQTTNGSLNKSDSVRSPPPPRIAKKNFEAAGAGPRPGYQQ